MTLPEQTGRIANIAKIANIANILGVSRSGILRANHPDRANQPEAFVNGGNVGNFGNVGNDDGAERRRKELS